MLYRDAGVDIDAATQAKASIKLLARKTFNARVLKEVGAFGGFFSIKGLPPGKYTVEAWQEKYGTKDVEVTVGAKESKTVDFEFTGA
jgi:phosphoribosylaminoimidazole (AIR) synthetase